jgi:protein-S-isoprenylcysteine O-methyltransferase Ste14
MNLELKIPPLVLAPLVAAAMWQLARFTPHFAISDLARWAASLAIAVTGVSFAVLGVLAFRRSGTTVDPIRPGRASSFVTSGVYRVTRNPMYLGLAMVLTAWAIFLASPWALVGPPFWVLYMNRFQVKPEERILAELFGEEYTTYVATVRRWL